MNPKVLSLFERTKIELKTKINEIQTIEKKLIKMLLREPLISKIIRILEKMEKIGFHENQILDLARSVFFFAKLKSKIQIEIKRTHKDNLLPSLFFFFINKKSIEESGKLFETPRSYWYQIDFIRSVLFSKNCKIDGFSVILEDSRDQKQIFDFKLAIEKNELSKEIFSDFLDLVKEFRLISKEVGYIFSSDKNCFSIYFRALKTKEIPFFQYKDLVLTSDFHFNSKAVFYLCEKLESLKNCISFKLIKFFMNGILSWLEDEEKLMKNLETLERFVDNYTALFKKYKKYLKLAEGFAKLIGKD